MMRISSAAAEQPEAIGKVLVEAIHKDLTHASIAYIFREKMKTRDRVVWGKMVEGRRQALVLRRLRLRHGDQLAGLATLTDLQKVALVDHELSHGSREEDAKGEVKWVLQSHDIEEFTGIVNRWGPLAR
jgi:hypothetical protein